MQRCSDRTRNTVFFLPGGGSISYLGTCISWWWGRADQYFISRPLRRCRRSVCVVQFFVFTGSEGPLPLPQCREAWTQVGGTRGGPRWCSAPSMCRADRGLISCLQRAPQEDSPRDDTLVDSPVQPYTEWDIAIRPGTRCSHCLFSNLSGWLAPR